MASVCYCKAGCSLRFTDFGKLSLFLFKAGIEFKLRSLTFFPEHGSRLGADPYSSVPLHEQQCTWPSKQVGMTGNEDEKKNEKKNGLCVFELRSLFNCVRSF